METVAVKLCYVQHLPNNFFGSRINGNLENAFYLARKFIPNNFFGSRINGNLQWPSKSFKLRVPNNFFGSRINGNGLEDGKRRTEDGKHWWLVIGCIKNPVSQTLRSPLSRLRPFACFFGSRINGNGLEDGKRRTEDGKHWWLVTGCIKKLFLKLSALRSPVSALSPASPEVELMETVWRTENGGRRTESIDG